MSHAATVDANLQTAQLYPRLAGYVRRALLGLGVTSADADDLTQDVFVTLHRRGIAFDSERSARSWLYGTARRVASNHRRSQRRARSRARRAPPPAAVPAPDVHVDRRAAAAAVERFSTTLSPTARSVFMLSEVEGLSGPDVAERLGMPLNTAYSHIRRVRSRLSKVAIAVVGLVLLALTLLAGTCGEATDERPRVALRAAADAGR